MSRLGSPSSTFGKDGAKHRSNRDPAGVLQGFVGTKLPIPQLSIPTILTNFEPHVSSTIDQLSDTNYVAMVGRGGEIFHRRRVEGKEKTHLHGGHTNVKGGRAMRHAGRNRWKRNKCSLWLVQDEFRSHDIWLRDFVAIFIYINNLKPKKLISSIINFKIINFTKRTERGSVICSCLFSFSWQ